MPIQVKPFLVRSNGTQGELSYTGFSATMLQSIANQSGFSYTFAEPNSTSIGRNGPLIDVANGVADATIGPIASLATSYQVSFTTSYLDTGAAGPLSNVCTLDW